MVHIARGGGDRTSPPMRLESVVTLLQPLSVVHTSCCQAQQAYATVQITNRHATLPIVLSDAHLDLSRTRMQRSAVQPAMVTASTVDLFQVDIDRVRSTVFA